MLDRNSKAVSEQKDRSPRSPKPWSTDYGMFRPICFLRLYTWGYNRWWRGQSLRTDLIVTIFFHSSNRIKTFNMIKLRVAVAEIESINQQKKTYNDQIFLSYLFWPEFL